MKPGKELLFLALGGSGEIGMNVNLYGCDGKWLMVDLGMTFADPHYPGIELVLPDLAFIEDRAEDLVGIVLTHGHEDHIGAIPYMAAELGVPLYATPFTAGLIAEKLAEAGLQREVKLKVMALDAPFRLGPFGLRYVPLAHSIAEGNALVIETPYGRIFHTGDWKLDEEPLVGVPSTAEELKAIGDAGVLALVCDSTNVFNPVASGSEAGVRDSLMQSVAAERGRVVVTTFASNVARLDTLGRVAAASGRRLCVAGRSLDRIIGVAQAVGYLADLPETVDFDTAMRLPRDEVMIIATGGQGEPRAALARIAAGNHPLKLAEGDAVLFSTKVIPGNEIAIGRIQNELAARGIRMITDRQAAIHVSGHPGRPELEAMYDWIRPDILVPVHGEMRHMQEQGRLGAAHGIGHVVVQKNGDLVRLAPGEPRILSHEATGRLVLDGDVILPAGGGTMGQRRKLAQEGAVMVALPLDKRGAPQGAARVEAMGLPLDEDLDAFRVEAVEDIGEAVRAAAAKRAKPDAIVEAARLAARRTATRWTGKRPLVQVLAVPV